MEVKQIIVTLPAELAAHYEAHACAAGAPLEAFVCQHIAATAEQAGQDHSAALYLSPADAKEMRRILGGRISTPQRLLDMLNRLTSYKLAGHKLELSPARQEAVVWLAKSLQQPVEAVLPKVIDEALGLRLRC